MPKRRAPLTNCLFVALYLWATRGGYLILRRSHYGPYPHFLWTPKLPTSMPVIHYTTDIKPRCAPVFRGKFYRRERGDADSWGLLLLAILAFCAGVGWWLMAHMFVCQAAFFHYHG